jgi:hypothetical protein
MYRPELSVHMGGKSGRVKWSGGSSRPLSPSIPSFLSRLSFTPSNSIYLINILYNREDQRRLAKQRKIEWLKKVYAQHEQSVQESRELRSQRSYWGNEVSEDQLAAEEEDLVRWTERLDFDSYMDEWRATAVSSASEAFLPQQTGDRLFGGEPPDYV